MQKSYTPHRRLVYLIVAAMTVIAGLTARFAPLGLPWIVMKYAGSALWAMMIYWVLALVWPQSNVARLALISGAIATVAEFSRLHHVAWLDTFRAGLPGIILLGRYFSVHNIVAYWLAIAAGAVFDAVVLRRLADGALLESN